MIWTIGYQRLTLPMLAKIVVRLRCRLVDVRARPYSSKVGFSKPQLEEALGGQYIWKGDVLGGPKPKGRGVQPEGIRWLCRQAGDLMLMCLEENPLDCHRHIHICQPHFPDALHLFRDVVFKASELARPAAPTSRRPLS
jgi:uncharacterized protein (DUF488 family)